VGGGILGFIPIPGYFSKNEARQQSKLKKAGDAKQTGIDIYVTNPPYLYEINVAELLLKSRLI